MYKTFTEWKNGNWLEDGEPRKEAYTKDELLLVEMGWKYGFDAGKAQQADRIAELEKELDRCKQSEKEGWRYSNELEAERKRLSEQCDAVYWVDDLSNSEAVSNQLKQELQLKHFTIPLYTTPQTKPLSKPEECKDGCPELQVCDYCQQTKPLEKIMLSTQHGQGENKLMPVAWMSPDGKVSQTEGRLFYIPLYTTPQTKPAPEGLIDPKSYYIGYKDGKKALQTKPLSDEEILEAVSAVEHEQWMAWANQLMHTETISENRTTRWTGLMIPYAELSEEMKEHDRVWARKVIRAIEERHGIK